MSEEKTLLKKLTDIIIGLTEVDQDMAVLDHVFRKESKEAVMARLDETIGSIMVLKEEIKEITVAHYTSSKFNSLIKKPKQDEKS